MTVPLDTGFTVPLLASWCVIEPYAMIMKPPIGTFLFVALHHTMTIIRTFTSTPNFLLVGVDSVLDANRFCVMFRFHTPLEFGLATIFGTAHALDYVFFGL